MLESSTDDLFQQKITKLQLEFYGWIHQSYIMLESVLNLQLNASDLSVLKAIGLGPDLTF